MAPHAREDQHTVVTHSDRFLVIVIGLLAALYGVSLLIVRNGQRLIDRQTRAQEEAARREALWHREKMAALATMAANVSHEVGNPLAIIAGIAQELPPPAEAGAASPTRRILEQTARVGEMARRISDFTTARSEQAECVDVNAMLQALLALLDARPAGAPRQALQVLTEHAQGGVRIRLGAGADAASTGRPGGPLAIAPRLDAVQRRVAQMGGRLAVADGQVRIGLPAAATGT